MAQQWIDVSVPMRSGMIHWPGNPPVKIERIRDIEAGASSNISMLSMGSHSGTHVDAPAHFIAGGRGIDTVDLDSLIGPARVIESRDRESIKEREIDELKISPGERILFRTRNSTRNWSAGEFLRDSVSITSGAARRLVTLGVRTVGIDYLSVGRHGDPDGRETHLALLSAGITIIEGLDLQAAPAGEYEMICLPLRIESGDGSPARVLLRPLVR